MKNMKVNLKTKEEKGLKIINCKSFSFFRVEDIQSNELLYVG